MDESKNNALKTLRKFPLWAWMVLGGFILIILALLEGSAYGLGITQDPIIRYAVIAGGFVVLILALFPWYWGERDRNEDRDKFYEYRERKRQQYLDKGIKPPEDDATIIGWREEFKKERGE